MIEQGFCPLCGRPGCTRHPQKGTDMVQFGDRLPLQVGDPKKLVLEDLRNIVAKNREIGLHETADIYQQILDHKLKEWPEYA